MTYPINPNEAKAEQVQSSDAQPSFLCWVVGLPVPQGSKVGKILGKRVLLYDDNSKVLKPWRDLVKAEATQAMALRETITGPVWVTLDFYMPRPASVKRSYPSVKPDIDKLSRAVLDSLTAADVWEDDARCVSLTAREQYADSNPAGVRINAGPMWEPAIPVSDHIALTIVPDLVDGTVNTP